jgi:hypothetical protein
LRRDAPLELAGTVVRVVVAEELTEKETVDVVMKHVYNAHKRL